MVDALLDDVITSSSLLQGASNRDLRIDPTAGTPPILVCRGPHAGACMLLARHGLTGLDGGAHGLVVEVDLNIPDHRHALRSLRTSLPEGTALVVVLPRIGSRHATEF